MAGIGTPPVQALITSWQAARAELKALEAAEHPDITDAFGRVWVWKARDLYRHCSTAAPADMIGHFGLPSQAALDNPNYILCDVCVAGRQRNVPNCKPEWNCSHLMHQPSAA